MTRLAPNPADRFLWRVALVYFAIVLVIAAVGSSVAACATSTPPNGYTRPPGRSVAPSFSTCAKFGTLGTQRGLATVQNDEWNSDLPQCVSNDGGPDFTVKAAQTRTDGPPASYPSIFAGCHWGLCNNGLTPGHQAGSLTTLGVNWTTKQPAGGIYDVSLDLWFNSTPATSGQPDRTELMVWYDSRGPIGPFGSQVASGVYFGTAPWNVVTYRNNPGTQADLMPLIRDAISRGYLAPSSYLISVEAGFEVWYGGTGLATTSFGVTVR